MIAWGMKSMPRATVPSHATNVDPIVIFELSQVTGKDEKSNSDFIINPSTSVLSKYTKFAEITAVFLRGVAKNFLM